jgi:hypothetical protein
MKRSSLLLIPYGLVLLVRSVRAADPDGFVAYKAAELQAHAKAAKLDENKAGVDRVATWGNHGLMVVRREGDGAVETHATQVDVVTVISGKGTLIVGGTVVGD